MPKTDKHHQPKGKRPVQSAVKMERDNSTVTEDFHAGLRNLVHSSNTGETTSPPIRVSVLLEASLLTMGARETDYGDFTSNMETMAKLTEVFLRARPINSGPINISASEMAIIMAFGKIARIAGSTTSRPKLDNYIDACGYLAEAYEATRKPPQETPAGFED
jgi:threonine synthase